MKKTERTFKLLQALAAMGFTYDESAALRRIERALHRWQEAECNGEIERDEADGVARRWVGGNYLDPHDPRMWRAVQDREAGAKKRLAKIVAARNTRFAADDAGERRELASAEASLAYNTRDEARINRHRAAQAALAARRNGAVVAYIQGDPRGCALYLLTREQVGAAEIESCYSNGVAVCT